MAAVIDPQGRLYSPKERLDRRRLDGFQFDSPTSYSYSRALDMVRRNTLIGTMVDLYSLLGRKASYQYMNADPEILEFIIGTPAGQDSQFYQEGQLQGRSSIAALTGMLSSYPVFGNLYAEFTPKASGLAWEFGVLDVLEPGCYRFLRRTEDSEEGFKGSIAGVSVQDVVIPLPKAVYLKHGDSVSFGDPYGYAVYERLESLSQAWAFVLEELLTVVGQQGGKKLVGLVEEGESKLLGANGKPLKDNGTPVMVDNAWLLAEQLGGAAKNNDAIVTSNKNTVSSIDHESKGEIFDNAIRMFRTLIMMGMLSPETIFFSGNSGLSGAGMAAQHASTLLNFIESMVEAIAEEIQRVIIDPLVMWNFGADANRGALVKKDSKDPDRIELLKILAQVTQGAIIEDEALKGKIMSKVAELVG